MKRYITLALAVFAALSLGAARDIRQSQKDIQHPDTFIFSSLPSQIDTDGGTDCLNTNRYGGLGTNACTNEQSTSWYVPKDITITKVVFFVSQAGDAAASCDFTFQDDTQTAITGAPVVTLAVDTAQVAVTDTTIWNVTEGDLIQVAADVSFQCVDLYNLGGPPQTSGTPDGLCDDDGTTTRITGCQGTADPWVNFMIYGTITN